MWHGWKQWLCQSTHEQHQSTRCSQPRLEILEDRITPTSVLYLDFGDNLPVGGLGMTVEQLRETFGAGTPGIQGPDLRNSGTPAMTDATNLTFTGMAPLVTFDYNADGNVDNADYTDLRTNVVALVQRYYQTLDVTVQIAPTLDTTSSATYMDGIRTTLQAGANVDGERDVWVFVMQVVRTDTNESVGADTNNNGIAAGADIGGNNARDDSALTYADVILAGNPNATADTRLAYTAAHEAGHTFGQRHRNNGTSGTTLDADMTQLTRSELVTESAGGTNRVNFVFNTRYPLIRGDGNNNPPPPANSFDPTDVEIQYNQLVNTNRLGPRAGAPDFVTGTGANDIITVTRLNATQATVQVEAFRNTDFTSPIDVPGQPAGTTVYSYTIDTTNGILIEGGFGTDRYVLDATIGGTITIRGAAGTDELVVLGNNAATGSYTPGATIPTSLDSNPNVSGTVVVGSTTINFSEFRTASPVTVQDVTSFTFITPNSADILTVDSPTAGQSRISGTTGGVGFAALNFFNIANFIVDTGTNDGGAVDDTVTVNAAALVAAALQNFTVTTGNGDDELILNLTDYALPVAGGAFTFQGGAGTDRVTGNADVNFNLSDTSLGIDGDGSVALTSVERATLTGGSGANTFNVTNWTGIASLDGGNAGDIYNVTITGAGSGEVNVNDTGVGGTDTVNVTGTIGADIFNVSAGQITRVSEQVTYTGVETVTLNGDTGMDAINGPNTPTIAWNITGANTGNIVGLLDTFTSIENLNGGTGQDDFLFDGGSLDGTVSGGGVPVGEFNQIVDQTNRVNAWVINDLNAGTVGFIAGGFTQIQSLAGGPSTDTFTFTDAVGTGGLDGSVNGGAGAAFNTITDNVNRNNVWIINGPNSGVVGFLGAGFSSIQNLIGSQGNESFNFANSGSLSGFLDGAAGNDVIADHVNRNNFWIIHGSNSGVVGFIGAGFLRVENLVGSQASESFNFTNTGQISGFVDGAGGNDAIADYVLRDNFWIIHSLNSGLVGYIGLGFYNVENLIGSQGSESFNFTGSGSLSGFLDGATGNDAIADYVVRDNFWIIHGPNSGGVGFIGAGFFGIENLIGSQGSESFNFTGSGLLSGFLDGAAGNDAIADYVLRDNFWIIHGPNSGVVGFIGVGFFSIENLIGSQGSESFNFTSSGSLSGFLDGAAGNDAIADYVNRNNFWVIHGPNSGVVGFIGAGFFRIENLIGSQGSESFLFANSGILSGFLDGAAGQDWLDYSLLLIGISVNLSAATASLTGGVYGIEHVRGSAVGNSTLIGNEANNILVTFGVNNQLFGLGGRDLQISGIGKNLLDGGEEDDLLIGGRTAFDLNNAALLAVLAEWTRWDISYEARVQNLRTGQGLSGGNPLIIDATVFVPFFAAGPQYGRGGGDRTATLIGGPGRDWFFTGLLTAILDPAATELVN